MDPPHMAPQEATEVMLTWLNGTWKCFGSALLECITAKEFTADISDYDLVTLFNES